MRLHHPPFFCVSDESEEAVEAVDELAIGHGDEQCEDDADVQCEQQAHRTKSARPVRLVRNSIARPPPRKNEFVRPSDSVPPSEGWKRRPWSTIHVSMSLDSAIM